MLADVLDWLFEKLLAFLVRWYVLVAVGVAFLVAAAVTGDPAWAVGGIAIPVGLLLRTLESRTRQATRLLRRGEARWAQVLGIRETSTSTDETGGRRVIDLALRLDGPGERRVGIRQVIGVRSEAVTIGSWLPVRVDTRAPWRAVVDWAAAGASLRVPADPVPEAWRALRTPPPDGFSSAPDESAPVVATVLAVGAWLGVVAFATGAVLVGGAEGIGLAAAALLTVVVAGGLTAWARRTRRRAGLLARPERWAAVVVSAKQTGGSVNDRQVLRLHLRIDHPSGSREVKVRRPVPDAALARVGVGTTLPVAYDPSAPKDPVIDWPRFLGAAR